MVQEDIIRRVYENMKGNTPALNQFREDNSLGKIEEGEKVARGAQKRAEGSTFKKKRYYSVCKLLSTFSNTTVCPSPWAIIIYTYYRYYRCPAQAQSLVNLVFNSHSNTIQQLFRGPSLI